MAAGGVSEWKEYDAEMDAILGHADVVAAIKAHVGAEGDITVTGKRMKTQVVAGIRLFAEAEVEGAGEKKTVYATVVRVAGSGDIKVERVADTEA